MKMNKILIATLAAGMLTACSDSTDVTPTTGAPQWNADGSGYVSLSINLPTAVSDSRSNSDNDQFQDGEADEYAVKDATLILFAGENEADATFAGAYQLAVPSFVNDASQQVTSTAKITRRINQTAANLTHIYAYVALNATQNGLFQIGSSSSSDIENTGLTVGTTEFTDATTFAQFQELTANIPTSLTNGLLMVNAPLASVGSTTSAAPNGTVQTLADLNTGNIRATASEAAANPAATIYVERAVAKVSFTANNGATGVVTDSPNENKIAYTIVGYRLDNTNPTSYITRHADATAGTTNWQALRSNAANVKLKSTGYRFVGNSAVAENLYRTYWAEDPNYATDTPFLTTSTEEGTIVTANQGSFANSYCMENTFDVAHMDHANTTRLIVKVKFGDANSTDDYLMYQGDMNTFQKAGSDFNNKVLAAINQLAAVKEAFGKTPASGVTYAEVEGKAAQTIASVTFGSETIDATSQPEILAAINSYIGEIAVYKGGIGYYQVRIKHFGDDLTPWNIDGDNKEWTSQKPTTWSGDINNIYPDADGLQNANYLGRYGVVRNNWYQVNVSGVQKIGTPEIPSVPEDQTPDDEIDSYISVNINILPWAVRVQDEVLQ